MRKVIHEKESPGFTVGARALEPGFDPSRPLANVKHERFCWAIVQGRRLGPAYEIAGFTGKSARLPWRLRHKPYVDARVSWLLAKRVEADTRARHNTAEKIADARLRLIARLEAIAYADPRDLAQWDRKPEFDREGNIVGWKNEIVVTPSHLLTKEQAAQVRVVTTKSGGLKFEVNDPLAALAQLDVMFAGSRRWPALSCR